MIEFMSTYFQVLNILCDSRLRNGQGINVGHWFSTYILHKKVLFPSNKEVGPGKNPELINIGPSSILELSKFPTSIKCSELNNSILFCNSVTYLIKQAWMFSSITSLQSFSIIKDYKAKDRAVVGDKPPPKIRQMN